LFSAYYRANHHNFAREPVSFIVGSEKTKVHTSRKPRPVSLVILAVWLVVVVGIGLLQVGGQPTELDELINF